MSKVQINANQLAILVVMNTLGTAIVFLPSSAAAYGGVNGWITVFLSTGIGVLLALLYTHIFKLSSTKDIFQLLEFFLGKWFGKLISLLFIFYIFVSMSGNIWGMGQFLTTQILVETPMEVINGLIIFVSIIGVRMGVEVIARSAEIFFPYTLISLLLLVILVFPEAEIINLRPMFKTNISGTLIGAIPIISVTFLELIFLLGFLNNVNGSKQVKKAWLLGTLISGGLLTIITLMCIGVLGAEITVRHTYPTYVLGKKISIANFLERIEVIVAIAWFFTIYFKIVTGLYVINKGLVQLLNLNNHHTLTIPLSYLIFISSVTIYPNNIVTAKFENSTWVLTSLTFGLGLPILISILSLVRRMRKVNG